MAGVLLTQNHLFTSPPRFTDEADDTKPSPAAGIDVKASTNWVHLRVLIHDFAKYNSLKYRRYEM